jgi:hypothetical protein
MIALPVLRMFRRSGCRFADKNMRNQIKARRTTSARRA